MAQTEELDLRIAVTDTGAIFADAQELAISGKKEAYDLYLKAALAGNPAAAYMICQYLDRGLADGDGTDALFWGTYAYLGRYPAAEEWLRGYFAERDIPADGELYSRCLGLADKGNGPAAFMAGMACYTGIGTGFDPAKAYGLFCRSADLGNADGACEKALCLIRGSGTGRNIGEGLGILEELCSKGCERALIKYAEILEYGFGVPRNREKALSIYVSLAEKKHPYAAYQAGRCYMDGIGTAKDPDMAYSWFCVSQAMGSPEGDFGMARCILAGIVDGSVAEGIPLMKHAAERRCSDAMFMLAQLYNKDGRVVKRDTALAMRYYEEAAYCCNTAALIHLFRCYSAGENVKKNASAAFGYAARAAAYGSIDGCYEAGHALLTGTGVKKDEAEGFRLCRIASDEGYMKAAYTVANCYIRGRGVPRDFKKGFAMHEALVSKGYARSSLLVGESYYLGDGVDRDYGKAFKAFQVGAENGNAVCQFYLGECYDKGNGTRKDPKVALEWYAKAAKQGHIISQNILEERHAQELAASDESPFALFEKKARAGDAQAMFIVGRYYEEGIGIAKDIEKAKEWYTKAKKRGNAAARKALEDLGGRQRPVKRKVSGFNRSAESEIQCHNGDEDRHQAGKLVDNLRLQRFISPRKHNMSYVHTLKTVSRMEVPI